MKLWMRLFAVTTALLAASAATAAASSAPNQSTAQRASRAPSVGVVTMSPLPGDRWALPGTQISFLGAPSRALSHISVVGSRSGGHSGRTRSYISQTGTSFIPAKHFTPGEQVTVHATLSTSKGTRHLSTSFVVAQPVAVPFTGFPVSGNPSNVQSFQSRPDLKPPTISITQPAGAVGPGLLMATPDLGPGQPGPLIFDNNGQVVWSNPVPSGLGSEDFRTQTYGGKTVLTWWQGQIIRLGYGVGKDIIMNNGYHTVATVYGGNGLAVDGHEFLLTRQGSALVTAYSPVQADESSVHGPSSGTVLEGVIQQIDVKTRLVMYEWHSLDHVPLVQSFSTPPASANGIYDYFHVNSIAQDSAGHLIVSARNTSTIYDISPHSGNLLWRLGGKASTFTEGANVPFGFQHNAIPLSGNRLSLFDDDCCAAFGPGAPVTPLFQPNSRGEVISLKGRTATLVQQFVHQGPKPLITASQGGLQSLSNGDWMIGWGGLPNFTEFNSAGQQVFDGTFPVGENSYRVYRLPWTAQPTTIPAVAAKPSGSGLQVFASWNGATTVASWKVLSGASPTSLAAVATAARSGFETTILVAGARYVEVQAVSAAGKVLGTSKPLKVS